MNEVIIFVFCNFMDFSNNKFKIKSVGNKNFFKCVRNLLYGSHVIHHSHVTGEIKAMNTTSVTRCYERVKILYLFLCITYSALIFSLF